MENTFTPEELLDIINLYRSEEELKDYTLNELCENIEFDEVQDYENINIYEVLGLLAYQPHIVRFLITKKILNKDFFSISEFCKKNAIEVTFGEIIKLSNIAKIESKNQKKQIVIKKNNKGKDVKYFDKIVLMKIFNM